MSKTKDYVQAIEHRYHTTNGKELAQLLGVVEMSISRYRNDQKGFADDVAIRAAELLDLDPRVVLAELHEERAATTAERYAWADIIATLRTAPRSKVVTSVHCAR